jgi:type IV secretory pathway VirB2 component (pilin)
LGEAEVTANDLVAASLRMRPDRIILGELRGPEAYAFLRAVNTGHPGSMTTVHADSAARAIEQIVLLVLQSGTQRPSVRCGGRASDMMRPLAFSAAAALASLASAAAAAQSSLSDPAGANVLAAAAVWLQEVALGTVATVAAVIAVASVGLLTLTGRLHWRRGASVVLGCFILFGSPTIVAGLLASLANERPAAPAAAAPEPPPPPALPAPTPSSKPNNTDPFAGASVSSR